MQEIKGVNCKLAFKCEKYGNSLANDETADQIGMYLEFMMLRMSFF